LNLGRERGFKIGSPQKGPSLFTVHPGGSDFSSLKNGNWNQAIVGKERDTERGGAWGGGWPREGVPNVKPGKKGAKRPPSKYIQGHVDFEAGGSALPTETSL